MLLSCAIIILLSLSLSRIAQLLRIPRLIGMLITGILLGPFILNLIDPSILNVSGDLRQIALIVILIRAGLSLDLEDLKRVGRPALFLSFIPALFEFFFILIFAPMLFSITAYEAAILGAIVAAVSPAVIVPRMIKLIDLGYGKDKSIPQMVLAGASIDDVFIIILFSSLILGYSEHSISIHMLYWIPISIFIGVSLGILFGYILVRIFKKFHMRDTVKVLIIFAIGFLFIAAEEALKGVVMISGLTAVMVLGGTILKTYPLLAGRLVYKFEKVWVIAEIMLFVLVGAALDVRVIPSIGLLAILLVIIGLVGRTIGVQLSLIKTGLSGQEKTFVSISYLPKATVQAAIGAIPLSLGLPNGQLILGIAVLSIILTAPIGATLIDYLSPKHLKRIKE